VKIEDEVNALDRLQPEWSALGPGPHAGSPRAAVAAAASKPGPQILLVRRWRNKLAFRRPRSLVIALLAALLTLQAAAIVYLVRRSSGDAIAGGTLVLETDPPGAAVRLDGVDRGVTPLTMPLSSGEHRAEVSLGSWRREFPVVITSGLTVSRHVQLAPAAAAVGTSGLSGELDLRSRPTGASIKVDGVSHGRTPRVVGDLSPGQHRVVMRHGAQQLEETLTVPAGSTLQFAAAFPAEAGPKGGWLSVKSPVELSVLEDGVVIGTTRADRTMLPVGRHSLEFVNQTLGYRATRTIEIAEGKVATITPELPRVAVNINALPWAEVWLGDRKLGDTPIAALALPLGVHQMVFKHPSLGERRETVTVAAGGPVRVSVDMRK
jgi:hypothetical protein